MLIVGRDKTPILEHLPSTFLLIDDGPLIDALPPFGRRKVTYFDVSKHSLNPLKDINYLRARQFIDILNAVFPEGDNTLTKKNSNFQILSALLSNPKRLDKLIPRRKEYDDARQKIETLLLSPVLNSVLTQPTNFSLDGILIARLDRAQLGDFDCFVLANLLIGQYSNTVIIPDFGFYGCPFHTSLIRQNRLIAGVNFLDESPLKNYLLLIEEKIGAHTTAKDADTLASYAGLHPGFNNYNTFVDDCIRG